MELATAWLSFFFTNIIVKQNDNSNDESPLCIIPLRLRRNLFN